MKREFFFVALMLAALLPAFSGERNIMGNESLDAKSFSLENGLSVFLIEDFSCATVKVKFVCRAGYSSQTIYTAGFFPMYARLFPSSADEPSRELFSLCDLRGRCEDDAAVFEADVPVAALSKFMGGISQCVLSAKFSDDAIKSALKKAKSDSEFYSKTAAGLINSAIDFQVFKRAPWKRETGIYPSMFDSFSPQQARSTLYNIGKKFYVPKNCAVFLSGPVSSEDAYSICAEKFSAWDAPVSRIDFPDIVSHSGTEPETRKKFVLVSRNFSPDFTQIVVEYDSLGATRTSLAAAAINLENSALKNSVLSNHALALRSGEYLAATTSLGGSRSRLILQTLLEKPYSFAPPGIQKKDVDAFAQAEEFLGEVSRNCRISADELEAAKDALYESRRFNSSESCRLLDLISDFWILSGVSDAGTFFSEFHKSLEDIGAQDEAEISSRLSSEEPFVFVIMNERKFAESRKSFVGAGYEILGEKNSAWHFNAELARIAKSGAAVSARKKDSGTGERKSSPARDFFMANVKSIRSGILGNGIPVAVKENRGSQTVALSVCIDGGKFASPEDEKKLREILVDAFTKNSSIEGARAETFETLSFVTAEVRKEHLAAALSSLSSALIFGEISPVAADILLNQNAMSSFSRNADLGFQMKSSALAYLYRDSGYSDYFKIEEAKVVPKYSSMLLGYTRLLDASLYSILICGDIDFEEAKEAAEKSFGMLRAQSERSLIEIPAPEFKSKERRVQLRHLFHTDKTPEMAGNGIPILIPTKNFQDPCQIYFSSPTGNADLEIFNALIGELAARIQAEMKNEFSCSACNATQTIPVAYIQGNALARTGIFLDAFKSARRKLFDELSSDEKKSAACEKIKSRWTRAEMSRSRTNAGTLELLKKGAPRKNPSLYLENYISIESATPRDFAGVMERFIPEEPPMKVYSVDSKK